MAAQKVGKLLLFPHLVTSVTKSDLKFVLSMYFNFYNYVLVVLITMTLMTTAALLELENKFENASLAERNRTLDNVTTYGLQTYNDSAHQLHEMDSEIQRLTNEIDAEEQKHGIINTAHDLRIL